MHRKVWGKHQPAGSLRASISAIMLIGLISGCANPTLAANAIDSLEQPPVATNAPIGGDPSGTPTDPATELPADMQAKFALDQGTQERKLEVLHDYIRWESAKAAKAADELVARLELADSNPDVLLTKKLKELSKLKTANEAKSSYSVQKTGAVATLTRSKYKATKPTQAINSNLYKWQTFVSNMDGQAAVDACAGGLTYSPEISKALGKAYYPIHVSCNGIPVLSLQIGDKIHIADLGDYVVVDARDISQGDTTRALEGLKGTAVLQTCYETGTKMRAVGIQQV